MKLFKVIETSYKNFDQSIKTYLSKTLGTIGEQYSKSNIFGVIFEGIKNVLQNMMFYIEDAMNEQNVFTAIRKKSIYSLAKVSGYDPWYGSAASGTVVVSNFIANGFDHPGTKIYLHNGALLQNNATGMKYAVYMPIDYYVFDLAKPLASHEVKVVQGTWIENSFTAKGETLETVEVNLQALFDKEYVEVYVDGERYGIAACLYDMTEDSKECVINVGYEGGFSVLFGNGAHGKRLIEGQNVTVKYLSHNGADGNILPSEEVTLTILSGCYDGYGNSVDASKYIKISVSNYITGGTDSDSIKNVRNMIGYNSRSLVLATEDNYKLFLNRFSFIGQTNIWMEKNSLSVTVSCLTNKKEELTSPSQYLTLEPTDLTLTENHKEMILSTLKNSNKSFAGITMKFQDPIIAQYSIICYAKIPGEYSKDATKSNIMDSIADYFMSLSYNTYFIPKSDIVKKVLAEVSELESFDIEILSKDNEDGYANGIYYVYELKFVNGTYQYKQIKRIYDSQNPIGLDSYGNISIESRLQVPFLHGNFKYYYDKGERVLNKKNLDYINTETVQVIFI